MRALRRFGRFIWRFMVIFSFVVNVILVIVLLALGVLIFDIKNNIATPLVAGLHSSFVGLDHATIDWTIPVRDEIPVVLDIPLQTNTVVTLTNPVPLSVSATIIRQGVDILGGPVTVNLQLPTGLQLPVALDLNVEVDQTMPVELDVRAVIPLEETQLHDVADNLRLLLEPFAIALHNLPDDFGGAFSLGRDVITGNAPDLLAPNDYSRNPWPGYSMTAGLGYHLYNEPIPADNLPVRTGIVPPGGISALDEQLRPELYEQGGPQAINRQAQESLQTRGLPARFYRGGLGQILRPPSVTVGQAVTAAGHSDSADLGILIPTPEP